LGNHHSVSRQACPNWATTIQFRGKLAQNWATTIQFRGRLAQNWATTIQLRGRLAQIGRPPFSFAASLPKLSKIKKRKKDTGKMKISKVYAKGLRNDEHFQFHMEIKDLIARYGAEALKITEQFAAYLQSYEKLDEGIKKIVKSAFTAEIQDADRTRDAIWNALIHMNAAALRHFDPEAREAAKRLKIVFDTYGNVARKPLYEQTAALYNILQDLQGKYAADVTAARLKLWVDDLQTSNIAFEDLVKGRFDEAALKTDVVVRETRAQVDEDYHAITRRLAALVEVEGAADYEQFIRGLNAVVDRYAATLARRK
jgi:hypothetical protein